MPPSSLASRPPPAGRGTANLDRQTQLRQRALSRHLERQRDDVLSIPQSNGFDEPAALRDYTPLDDATCPPTAHLVRVREACSVQRGRSRGDCARWSGGKEGRDASGRRTHSRRLRKWRPPHTRHGFRGCSRGGRAGSGGKPCARWESSGIVAGNETRARCRASQMRS